MANLLPTLLTLTAQVLIYWRYSTTICNSNWILSQNFTVVKPYLLFSSIFIYLPFLMPFPSLNIPIIYNTVILECIIHSARGTLILRPDFSRLRPRRRASAGLSGGAFVF